MVLDKFVGGYIKNEIPFAEQKIKDYFSPQGTFPDEMLLADELRKQTYEVPKGYTEQEAMELLAMFGCSDECLRGATVSQSSAHNLSMDPEKNKALVQVFMMISNSLGANDYNRQKGLSEAYINARKKFRELSGQMEQGNLTETRRLFSEGIKNIILVDKGVSRTVDIKRGDLAGGRLLEMGLDFLEKHPEMRDPEILTDQDMEDIQIARGKVAFFNDFSKKAPEYKEKFDRGEAFTDDELAEIFLMNQIRAASIKEEERKTEYIDAEALKASRLPGGLKMPVGQDMLDILNQVNTQTGEELPIEKLVGKEEYDKYKTALETKVHSMEAREGYGNIARAFLYGYPQSKKSLMSQIKKSAEFKNLKKLQKDVQQKKKKQGTLLDELESWKDFGIINEKVAEKVLHKQGLSVKTISYHEEAISKNREYAEALEAKRTGKTLNISEEERAAIREKKEEAKDKMWTGVPEALDKNICEKVGYERNPLQENFRDEMEEFIKKYPESLFVLDKEGRKTTLNLVGADTEEIREQLLDMDGRTCFLQLPEEFESDSPIWAVQVDLNGEDIFKVSDADTYMQESAPEPEKPSLWKRIFAFMVPSYRKEVDDYNKAMQEFTESQKEMEGLNGILTEIQKKKLHNSKLQKALRGEGTEKEKEQKIEKEAEKEMAPESKAMQEAEKDPYVQKYEKLLTVESPEYLHGKMQYFINDTFGLKKEISPAMGTLALLNSITSMNDLESEVPAKDYLRNVLRTDYKDTSYIEIKRLERSYKEIEWKMQKGETPLLPGERLRNFCNMLMDPELSVPEFASGAVMLHEFGEENLKQALGMKKSDHLPREIKGIMEYGGIYRGVLETNLKEAKKAAADPNAKPAEEELLDVLIVDSIDQERVMKNAKGQVLNVRWNENNGLRYTPLLSHLGKWGIDAFRKEVSEAIGPDYLKERAAKGSKEFVENHRKNLGAMKDGTLTSKMKKANGRKIKQQMEMNKAKQQQAAPKAPQM